MHCTNCENKAKLKAKKKNIKYDISGLDYITLIGVKVYECSKCGETFDEIKKMSALHAAIAAVIVSKKGMLNGPEIRFLRTYLGHSTKKFSDLVGMDEKTISRIENGKQTHSETLDQLIRIMAATCKPNRDYSEDDNVLDKKHREDISRIEVRHRGPEWDACARA